MQKTTAKIITISDIIQWNEKKELELSPKYQRNSVWNEKAKSYLIDTIIRGLPIPPIFLRQKVDVITKTTYREIIDGQQRIRAILEYVVTESFSIKKSHNKEFGGKFYSSLEEEVQEAILEYEILAEVVTEKDESVVYDMFARLNSNNIILNKQELRNSKYWGEFKVLVYSLSSKYRDFFLEQKFFSDNDCSRMHDCELINSMLIVILKGIVTETPTYIDNIYKEYDKEISNIDDVENKFRNIMKVINLLYKYFNGNSGCFQNKNYFYTLYCVIVNQMYRLDIEGLIRNPLFDADAITDNIQLLYHKFTQFISEYDANIKDKDNVYGLYAEYTNFDKNNKSRTTSKPERINRIKFLNNIIGLDE